MKIGPSNNSGHLVLQILIYTQFTIVKKYSAVKFELNPSLMLTLGLTTCPFKSQDTPWVNLVSTCSASNRNMIMLRLSGMTVKQKDIRMKVEGGNTWKKQNMNVSRSYISETHGVCIINTRKVYSQIIINLENTEERLNDKQLRS